MTPIHTLRKELTFKKKRKQCEIIVMEKNKQNLSGREVEHWGKEAMILYH